MHAGAYLIRLLEDQGVARIFTVPDESFLAALDGLHGSRTIETIICRQEAGAAMSAAATGRLTGRPGIALVAGGGGASCAAVGVHVARRDGAPMVLLVGLASPNVGDQPVIEPDGPTAAVGAMAKSFHILRSRSGLANLVAYAFHEALSGMPGPVVIGLPSDLLAGPAPDVAPNTADRGAPARAPAMAARTGLSEDVAFEIATRLAQAERPFIVIGGGGWSSRAAHRLQAFAELLNVPVATAPRRQDFIDNRSAVYAGHVGTGAPAGLVSALRDSDALLVIGAQASELAAAGILPINGRADGPALLQITATLGDAAASAQPVIQALCANQEAVDQLFLASQDLVAEAPALADPAHRVDRLRELHNAQVTARQPEPGPGTVQLGEVIRTVADTAPDAIICSGTGNYTAWVQRHHPFTAYGTQLASTAEAKGFGLPAAIAAALTTPERPIICYAGDGCFMATAGELATVRQYGLKLTIIVANNGMFGAVRMHQESQYPERIAGTTLVNPDFVALAGAYGGRAWRVSQTAAFSQCLAEALDHEGVSLIELQLDPNAMTPTASLQDIRGR